MEWIGCTVCEISAFKLHCDLETGVRGHWRSSKVALFNRAHTTLHSSSIVTMPLSSTYPFRDIAAYWSKIASFCYPPPCIWRLFWGWSRQIYATTLGDEKLECWAYQTVKKIRWYVQPFWYNTHVWQTDGQTAELAWHIRAIAYMLSRVKTAGDRLGSTGAPTGNCIWGIEWSRNRRRQVSEVSRCRRSALRAWQRLRSLKELSQVK